MSAGLVGLVVAGCAAQSPRPARPDSTPTYGMAPAPAETDAARTALNVIGTPFFVAFKVAVCALTVAVGGPALGVAALSDPNGQGWQRQGLADGFAANCGPPWVLR